MITSHNDHVLDNPIWHTINSYHGQFATGTALAKRYLPTVGFASALLDHSDAALHDLGQITPVGEKALLFEAHLPQHMPGWTQHQSFSVDQLVCAQPVPPLEQSTEIIDLTPADVPDILHLIELTQPGPFFSRTIEVGRYIGIRQQGQLVAMAGERLHLPGYCELSAVCTHPEWQGRGYARLLSTVIVNGIWERGETPFLHVVADNTNAYRLYESLHFRQRCEMTGVVVGRE